MWVSQVTLRPRVAYAGNAPSATELDRLHHDAHDLCFIANSVTSDVRIEPPAA
jgi:organic hydroperoxide reductase OsmC/OhrA